jgi:hypothetical protein
VASQPRAARPPSSRAIEANSRYKLGHKKQAEEDAMTEGVVGARGGRVPWHLWAVGALTLLWNAYGGFDYLMTQTENPGYLAMYTPEQRAYFTSFPLWMDSVWAIGVWGAVLGSVLLLLRRRWAYPVFAVSVAAFLVSVVYNYLLSDGARIAGATGAIFSVVIALIGIGEVLYSRAMARRGVLR